jgi:Ser/Thr protein kinase RdoA (MazF antagonist)
MPEILPVLMPSGQIRDQECLTVAELAAMLHTTRDAIYRKTGSDAWPYLKIVRRIYFTPDNLRTILALSAHDPQRGIAPPPAVTPEPSNVRPMQRRQGGA